MANLFNPERKSRLDAPERAEWQKPDDVVAALRLKPGAVVADIGAGTGYFAFRLADAVGPSGRVYAVDLQQEMLDTLQERAAERGATHVIPTRSGPVDIPLPDAEVDLVFIANVAHEYGDLEAGIRSCARILKPGGRLVVIDWKPEETPVGPPLDHRLTPEQVMSAARAAGFSETDSLDLLPYHCFLLFSRE